MKNLILIASLLMASSLLWAEQKVCDVYVSSYDQLQQGLITRLLDKPCQSGDILSWGTNSFSLGRLLVARFCHQEKQISHTDDFRGGVCTYTGKKLEARYR